ncbi:MAG: CDP-alcohol phosphatidyltransferase family protein, partial [Candidatus Latescibacteria bacterium]|nr:CDP-alcohol phosphatidyltransferase family protein [Candidatus Latescibacterota bacterium]
MSTSISGNLRFLIPNLMTLMVSLGGLAAMGIAYYQHTRMAALMFLVCGFFDGLDGLTAR